VSRHPAEISISAPPRVLAFNPLRILSRRDESINSRGEEGDRVSRWVRRVKCQRHRKSEESSESHATRRFRET